MFTYIQYRHPKNGLFNECNLKMCKFVRMALTDLKSMDLEKGKRKHFDG